MKTFLDETSNYTKKCTKCKENKLLQEFGKKSKSPDGYSYRCKHCYNSSVREYRKLNKEIIKSIHKKWRDKNTDKIKEIGEIYRTINREKIREHDRKYRQENPELRRISNRLHRINNPEKVALGKKKYASANLGKILATNAKRKAFKLKATPKWLTSFDKHYIEHLYIQAKQLEKLDAIKYHIDHIIPLKHELVCGLHVPWNLQILTSEENIKKNNKFDGTYENISWDNTRGIV